jgi:hypothetical protein
MGKSDSGKQLNAFFSIKSISARGNSIMEAEHNAEHKAKYKRRFGHSAK